MNYIPKSGHLQVTAIESPNTSLPVEILPEYHMLCDAFSSVKAVHLLLHHPWDCVIDLIPGTEPPCTRVYPLSLEEAKATEKYVEVPSAIEQLRGVTVFTWLDLQSTYNLVHVQAHDKWKTAFSTTSGHYEYLVMVYELMNALSFFQLFVNDVPGYA